jgi:hypothetical protein
MRRREANGGRGVSPRLLQGASGSSTTIARYLGSLVETGAGERGRLIRARVCAPPTAEVRRQATSAGILRAPLGRAGPRPGRGLDGPCWRGVRDRTSSAPLRFASSLPPNSTRGPPQRAASTSRALLPALGRIRDAKPALVRIGTTHSTRP